MSIERLITFKGQTRSIAGWARKLGVPHSTLSHRFRYKNWTLERILTTPAIAAHSSGQRGSSITRRRSVYYKACKRDSEMLPRGLKDL